MWLVIAGRSLGRSMMWRQATAPKTESDQNLSHKCHNRFARWFVSAQPFVIFVWPARSGRSEELRYDYRLAQSLASRAIETQGYCGAENFGAIEPQMN